MAALGQGLDDIQSPFQDLNKRPSFLDITLSHLNGAQVFDENVCLNLDSRFMDYEDPEDASEPIKTYLRIRPYKGEPTERRVIEIKDCTTVLANSVAPRQSRLSKVATKKTEYKFTRVFDEECSQQSVFETTVCPLMDYFERGDNCLVFSYGATNSGKTYTMQGRNTQYGIIPRTLDQIFSRLGDRIYKNCDIQPFMYGSTKSLTVEEQRLILLKKSALLAAAAKTSEMKQRTSFASTDASENSHCDPVQYYAGMPLHNGDYRSCDSSQMVCLWVSFVELYNEKCYDLLQHTFKGKVKTSKELKVVTDKSGHAYIREITEIPVFNEEEAYAVYIAGFKQLQVGTTHANPRSSRSHCFFTMRAVELRVSPGGVYPVKIYRMTFCDLAGMERVIHTENRGEQLWESSKINQSLLSLLKVIRMIREKQACRTLKGKSFLENIPFRDSTLTRIFKSYFMDSTHIAMIVNVNPNPVMQEPTIQTLQNSAIASSIIVYGPNKVPKTVLEHYPNNISCLHSSRDLEAVVEETEEEVNVAVDIPYRILVENNTVIDNQNFHSSQESLSVASRSVQQACEDVNATDVEENKENNGEIGPEKPKDWKKLARTYCTKWKNADKELKSNELLLREKEIELKLKNKEIKILQVQVKTIEQETREKMVQLVYAEMDDINAANSALFQKQIDEQTKSILLSEKKAFALKNQLMTPQKKAPVILTHCVGTQTAEEN